MLTVQDLIAKKEKLSLIGLGYVGMPIAVAFAKKVDVIGYDSNPGKIERYQNGEDPTNEVGDEAIKNTTVAFTANENSLKNAKFHIVAVPTPIKSDHTPDLSPVINASKTLGRQLTKGSYVVYESTVYPGVTEEICLPILEQESGLTAGVDFKVGYSPERINPGDKVHRLETIVKIVSGQDQEALETIADVYRLVVEAGVYKAESIQVAEAAKVIENSQRDINIAFMNELSIIFNKLGINTTAVLEAAGTKWNFLKFTPGLVGGHCIGVDPYYLTYRAEEKDYHSRLVLAGRQINDDMGKYVAQNLIKMMIQNDLHVKGATIAIFGLAFKPNTPDTRNTRVIDIIEELQDYGANPIVIDPLADPEEVKNEYGLTLVEADDVSEIDAIVLAVDHDAFKEWSIEDFSKIYRTNIPAKVFFDIKSIFSPKKLQELGFTYWSL